MKKKQCSFCHKTVDRLWYSSPPTCMAGECRKKAQEERSRQSGTKTPEKKDIRLGKGIKPVSDKQALRLKEYRKARDEHFKKYPVCQYPGCTSRQVQLHHAAGRVGKLLTDSQYFRSLCDKHHRQIELAPEEAKKLGLSVNRLDK